MDATGLAGAAAAEAGAAAGIRVVACGHAGDAMLSASSAASDRRHGDPGRP
ncbi:hypothetical protein [Cupriavidus sp. L7L]|uniref:hypothetical protein n=1 Tax=Cupriavidus sp. L7L TaxID=2546443 RepID=UPI001FB7B36E|nr:hypothetical protein [Cupriavidus sp. L7L]